MIHVEAIPDGGARLVADGLTVELEPATLKQLIALSSTGLAAAPPAAGAVVLDETHPMWDHHSGGKRHAGPAWVSPSDLVGAHQRRQHLEGKACGVFFDVILEEPGRLFTSDEIVAAHPEYFTSAKAVAGSLAGFVKPTEELHRPFPFHWWEGAEGTPTRYAIRPSTAAVFAAAGK